MYSLYKLGPGVLPRKILENLECRKKAIYPIFEAYSLDSYFSLISCLFFSCYSLKFSGYSLYFKPSLFSNQ